MKNALARRFAMFLVICIMCCLPVHASGAGKLKTAYVDGREVRYIRKYAYVLEHLKDLKGGLKNWETWETDWGTGSPFGEDGLGLYTDEFVYVFSENGTATIYKVNYEPEYADGHQILSSGEFWYILTDGQATIVGYRGGVWGWNWPRTPVKDAAFAGYINNLDSIIDLSPWGGLTKDEMAGLSPSGTLAVPDQLDGYPVVALRTQAFEECFRTDIQLPQGLVRIDDYVFAACYYLHNLTIPDSVTAIGERAFWSCDDIVLHVKEGSYAEQYAKDNGIAYTAAK